mgnify:CR=1 FL=1
MTDLFLRLIAMLLVAMVGAYFASEQWQWDFVTSTAGAFYLLCITSPFRR